MKLILPYPPSVNTYWRRSKYSTYLSKKGREYGEKVKKHKEDNHPDMKPISGPLRVEVFAFPPDKRVRDIDNIAKSLLDSIDKAGYYHDDKQIKDLELHMMEKKKGGCVVVRIARRRPLPASKLEKLEKLIEKAQ